MTTARWLPNIALCFALAGCGGGGSGGGVSSSPTPPVTATPTPTPTPTNTTVTDLKTSQSFDTSSATTAVQFNVASSTTINSSAPAGGLTIAYDAATNSYTVSTQGRSQTFGPSELQSGSASGETKFRKSTASGNDLLTLVTTPYSGSTPNKYVAAGYWQRNARDGSTQTTTFDSFVFGFPTAASAVPRSGSAGFATDVFGLVSVPGQEPSAFQGGGTLTADFTTGIFSTETSVTEVRLVTGQSTTGGSLKLTATGRLTSDGTLTGNALYTGSARLPGTFNGRFYGPGAEEIGATFSASNSDGATATGSLTAQRDSRVTPANLALTNVTRSQRYFAQSSLLTVQRSISGAAITDVRNSPGQVVSQLEDQTSGNVSFGPPYSNQPGGAYTTTSIVSSPNPNFTRYQKTFNDVPTTLDLFKPGSANTELVLTYVTFGRWRAILPETLSTENILHFAYGYETPAGILGAKTGTASYRGIVYGAGGNRTTNTQYDVRGSSSYSVDFGTQKYTGALNLNGTPSTGGAATDFGRFDFAGRIETVAIDSIASLIQGNATIGEVRTRFYGPDGQEIAAPFSVNANGTIIAGVTVAKRD